MLPDVPTQIEDACLYACVETAARAWDARDKARDERDEALVRCDELEAQRDLARDVAARLEEKIAVALSWHTPCTFVDEDDGETDQCCNNCGLAWPCTTVNCLGSDL